MKTLLRHLTLLGKTATGHYEFPDLALANSPISLELGISEFSYNQKHEQHNSTGLSV